MQCEEFEKRLNAVLDERRRPEWDAELRLHCERCPDCRQMAAAYEILLDGFYELAAPEVSLDMPQRVVDDLRSRHSRARRASTAAAALAIAAGLLIALVPLVRVNSRHHEVARRPQWSRERHAAAVSKGDLATWSALSDQIDAGWIVTEWPELFAMAGSGNAGTYEGLARGTGQNLALVMLYMPGIGGGMGFMDSERADDDQPNWADHMSEGLKPLTESMTETLYLLLDSLPPASSVAAKS